MDINFKVGDEIIDCLGNVGYVKSICDCKQCGERGFFEPYIMPSGDYITADAAERGFKGLYKVGDRVFPEHVDRNKLKEIILDKKELVRQTQSDISKLEWLLKEVAKQKSEK
jgi:hypothetical protein